MQQKYKIIENCIEDKDKSFIISFIGHSNVGKSSIINKLISDELLHVSSRSSTTLPVCIHHQSGLQIPILEIKKDTHVEKISETAKIYEYIQNLNNEIKNDPNKLTITQLKIFVDTKIFNCVNTIIYDTPGYEKSGFQQLWSSQNETILKLSKAIFFVIDYEQMDQGYILDEYLKLKNYNSDIYFVINKIDKADNFEKMKHSFNVFIENIKKEFINYMESNMKFSNISNKELNISIEKIFPISIKEYTLTNNNNYSNLDSLINIISLLMNNSIELSIRSIINGCINIVNDVSTYKNSMLYGEKMIIPEQIKTLYVDKYIREQRIKYGVGLGIGLALITIFTLGVGSLMMTGGAVGITSTLSLLGGGSIASGGFGMLGGLTVLTTLTTISTGFMGFVGFKLYNSKDITNAIKNKDIDLYNYKDEMQAEYKIDGNKKSLPLYRGYFHEFKYHGKGEILYSSGKIFIKGKFDNGKCIKINEIYNNDNNNSYLFKGIINIKTNLIKGIYYYNNLEIPIEIY